MNTDIQLHQGDCLEVLKTLNDNSIDSVVTDPPYGINFMGKKWDYNVPNVEIWQQVLRVLKPGGHALVACGTRTQHRMAVNLEDAGFEIRDIVAWVYGSGFPKSQNIGKAVDKLQGNERDTIGINRAGKNALGQDSGWNAHENKTEFDITKGNSKYEGWGTALKPAMELFTLCRKPLEEKTIAKNVLKYNTGGINIDGCRVGQEIIKGQKAGQGFNNVKGFGLNTKKGNEQAKDYKSTDVTGRFPANFIHDGSDEVVSKFPDTKGDNRTSKSTYDKGIWGNANAVESTALYSDNGSAARYFYCAKASKSERNKGLEEFDNKEVLLGKNQAAIPKLTKSGKENHTIKNQNNHPTVKPIKLMKYLCKLITPVNGIVLDPYMGSGSTGIAAKDEAFNFTGIELDKDYFEIAKARINAKEAQEKLF